MTEIRVDTPALPSRIDEKFSYYVYRTVSCLFRGKTNNIGVFEIPAGSTEVTVNDSRVTPNSHISITGIDNDSKSGVLSITERNSIKGYFKVSCPSSENDQNFSYAVIG